MTSQAILTRGGQRTAQRRGSGLIPGRWYGPFVVSLVVLLAASIIIGISVGSVNIPLDIVWRVIADHVIWFADVEPADRINNGIIWEFRVPRALLGAVVGAALAVAGVILQAVIRNPLADPYILGVVQGGSFGAVLAIAGFTAAAGKEVLSGAAFAGAMVSLILVLFLGRRHGRLVSTRLVLSGVAIGYLFSAGTSYIELQIAEGNSLAGVLFWLLGTVAAASWEDLGIPTIAVMLSMVWLLLQARPLNALLAGEETAASLGVDVSRLRFQLLTVTAVLTGAVVAVAGGVGFVGLMVPHTARLLVGPDHRRLLPVAALTGASFLVLVDIGARVLARPVELPLSVITAAIGAPFFLWLMRRSEHVGSERFS